MRKYYVAYGSNLSLTQFNSRCKDMKIVGTTVLNNYKLVFKGSADNYAYLTIEESPNSYVPLGVFEISESDELALDLYENYPDLYHKEYINININNKEETALIYVMNKSYNYHSPSFRYMITCIMGYNQFGFDKSILEKALRENPTIKRVKKKQK